MSREMLMMITRIQYWKMLFASDRLARMTANSKTMRIRNPLVSESTPLRMASGSITPRMSFKTSDPRPRANPLRYFQRYGASCRKTERIYRVDAGRRAARLLLIGSFLIDVPDRFQALKHALDVGLVIGKQKRSAGRRGRGVLLVFGLFRRRRFAPKLPVRDAFDQRLAREPPQMAQQAVRRIGVARIDHQHTAVVGERQLDDERKRRSAVEALDLGPGNQARAQLQMRLVDFDWRAPREIEDNRGTRQQQPGSDPAERPAPGDPSGKNRKPESGQPGPNVMARRSVNSDGRRHTFRLPPALDAVNAAGARDAF